MEDSRFGAAVRAERRRRGLRQVDVASKAGVSQQTVSTLERGRLDELTLRTLRRICQTLELTVEHALRSHGPDPDRLLDARHAVLVQAVVRRLGPIWTAIPEYSFNDYGDRGSVDVVAWHPVAKALLLVEVKSELHDLQAVLRSMDVKVRAVPRLVAREKGWPPQAVGSILVLPDESGGRRSVAKHGTIFDAALPARTVEVRRWVQWPTGGLRGIWFLADTPVRRANRNPGSPGRVRPSQTVALTLRAGRSRARVEAERAR